MTWMTGMTEMNGMARDYWDDLDDWDGRDY